MRRTAALMAVTAAAVVLAVGCIPADGHWHAAGPGTQVPYGAYQVSCRLEFATADGLFVGHVDAGELLKLTPPFTKVRLAKADGCVGVPLSATQAAQVQRRMVRETRAASPSWPGNELDNPYYLWKYRHDTGNGFVDAGGELSMACSGERAPSHTAIELTSGSWEDVCAHYGLDWWYFWP